jgi:MFS family permease
MASLALLLAMLIWSNFSPVLPLLVVEWRLSGAMAGAIVASCQAGYVISVFLTGYLADRIGGRRTFAISAIETGIFATAFALLAHDFWSALILRTLAGIGQGGLYVPGMRILSNWYPPRERGKAIGIFTCSLVGASAGANYVAGPLAALYGWRAGVFWTSVWAFPAAALVFLLVRDNPPSMTDGGSHETFRSAVLLNKLGWLITLSYTGHMWELYAMRDWLNPYINACARTLGYSATDALILGSVIAATCILMGGVSPGIGGFLSDRIGRCKAIILIMSLSIPCSLTYGWLIGLPLPVLAVVGLFYGFWIVADTAIFKAGLTELVPERFIGSALGLQSLLGFGVTTVSSAFLGVVLDWTNDPLLVLQLGYFPFWGWAFTQLGLVSIIGPIAAFILMRNPASAQMTGGKR